MVKQHKETLSLPVAPEDIRVGDYVAVLNVVAEYAPGCWCDVDASQKLEARRFMRLPQGDCDPLEVLGVCLPFVFVRQHDGSLRTLDVRRLRFARLEKTYGRRVFNMLKKGAKSRPRKDDDETEEE